MQDEVYAFQYCSCIYESAFATISLHKTKKGAYKAMRKYIEGEYAQWREHGIRYGKQPYNHGIFESWRIIPIQILD